MTTFNNHFFNNLDFTLNSEEEFYDTVDMSAFADDDAESIYAHLNSKMKLIPFGDYLKRYIYQKAGFDEPFEEIDIREYQGIIIESFAENCTPKAFAPTSSKLSALAKNWLTQTAVSRQTVFLLGFGLKMTTEDVSKFLVRAQRERDFNFRNPFEIICWYCYKNGYTYPKFEQLLESYEQLPMNAEVTTFDATIGIREWFQSIATEDGLMQKLAEIKTENNGKFFSVSAKRAFNSLYKETCSIIAQKYNEDEEALARRKANDYLDEHSNSVMLSLEEKALRAKKIRENFKTFTSDDITESDVEKFLCCGVPFDSKGNLLKFSHSALAKHFNNKRMSRQHIRDILTGKVDVDRFDLITLKFFNIAMDDAEMNNKRRYVRFTEETNKILADCCMGDLYITNPYECFLLMCILSDYPMGAYADVLEKSFDEN